MPTVSLSLGKPQENRILKTTVAKMPAFSTNDSFIGSDSFLKSLFDLLNKNFFKNALNGITLEWLTELKSRTAVSLIGKTSNFRAQTFICMSKPLLAKCTRKQLVESLMYEMISVYIDSCKIKGDNIDEQEKHFQSLLKHAMEFLNQRTGMHLSFNYTLRAHYTLDSYDEWIDVDDDINFHKMNDTVVCISDDDIDGEEEEEEHGFGEISKNGYVSITPVIGKINIRPDLTDPICYSSTLQGAINCCCCTDYVDLFKKCFKDTNITFDSTPNAPQKCPICSQPIEKDNLNKHLLHSCKELDSFMPKG